MDKTVIHYDYDLIPPEIMIKIKKNAKSSSLRKEIYMTAEKIINTYSAYKGLEFGVKDYLLALYYRHISSEERTLYDCVWSAVESRKLINDGIITEKK